MTRSASLRLELFVADLQASIAFYRDVLGFEPIGSKSAAGKGYTPMRMGEIRLGLNLHSRLGESHPVFISEGERPGRGVEIVAEFDDVEAFYQRVQASGWPISEPLGERPWGLFDFRVKDPDGYYWRFTSKSPGNLERLDR